jgi:hypothetical protein
MMTVQMKMMGEEKMSKAVSTKLTLKDYELCREVARVYYINGSINTPSVSELTRFALIRVFEEYRILMKPPRGAVHPRLSKR